MTASGAGPELAPGLVLVVGSLNVDTIVHLDHRPGPGETVLARSARTSPGGKGANQAVAAARAGVRVLLAGAVGDDAAGHDLVAALTAAGVGTQLVAVDTGRPTGEAHVSVTPDGENSIVVVAGANAGVTVDTVRAVVDQAPAGAVVVTQAELAPETVTAVVRRAAARELRCLLNLAPYVRLPADVLALADPLVVNASEAAALGADLGRTAPSPEDVPAALHGVARSLVVTLGAAGAALVDAGGRHTRVPAPAVQVVDSTGAGDAAVGALAAALANGHDLLAAVRAGVVAGSREVTRPGAWG